MNIVGQVLVIIVDRHLLAAREPHYKFVQILTVLCAGMLGLSAPQQSNLISQNHLASQLLFWSMIFLVVSIALGAVALYGEKQMHMSRVKEIRDALERHKGNETLATQECRRGIVLEPSLIHRAAFWIQCCTSLLAVVLLLLSRTALSVPIDANTHPQSDHNKAAGQWPLQHSQTNALKP